MVSRRGAAHYALLRATDLSVRRGRSSTLCLGGMPPLPLCAPPCPRIAARAAPPPLRPSSFLHICLPCALWPLRQPLRGTFLHAIFINPAAGDGMAHRSVYNVAARRYRILLPSARLSLPVYACNISRAGRRRWRWRKAASVLHFPASRVNSWRFHLAATAGCDLRFSRIGAWRGRRWARRDRA